MQAAVLTQLDGAFRGADAVAAGLLTPAELRGPKVQRLFQGVYALAWVRRTHALYCDGAAMIAPADAVLTGRSAATVRGVQLAWPEDPVELAVPTANRIVRRRGLDVRRTDLAGTEWTPWHAIGIATPHRMVLDLLLDRELPDAVADLDAVLRAGTVDLTSMQRLVAERSDRGIVAARRAVTLSDPRAESRPESRMRVWLALDGLQPVPQYWLHDDRGPLACVDLAFPERRLAVEYDGSWREEPWALNRDRARLNRVHALGWDVVFVTAPLLRDPPRMVWTVRSALARTR